jgi:hypothetical protein
VQYPPIHSRDLWHGGLGALPATQNGAKHCLSLGVLTRQDNHTQQQHGQTWTAVRQAPNTAPRMSPTAPTPLKRTCVGCSSLVEPPTSAAVSCTAGQSLGPIAWGSRCPTLACTATHAAEQCCQQPLQHTSMMQPHNRPMKHRFPHRTAVSPLLPRAVTPGASAR